MDTTDAQGCIMLLRDSP